MLSYIKPYGMWHKFTHFSKKGFWGGLYSTDRNIKTCTILHIPGRYLFLLNLILWRNIFCSVDYRSFFAQYKANITGKTDTKASPRCIVTLIWGAQTNWFTGQSSGPHLNIKMVFPGIWISILKIRQSWNRLIFIMGIPILLRWYLYIEMGPWSLQ